ncbi:hypothetical protein V144x_40340 [Gimesia aquarii]|uniref:Uncharacterized protein n=1 Tax=Gimesia aquarii TaxID=2527964 RepID=A0A517VZV4_9PLAN|nr:hypothetical protein V144x_40340 [Gimesia aquarii]
MSIRNQRKIRLTLTKKNRVIRLNLYSFIFQFIHQETILASCEANSSCKLSLHHLHFCIVSETEFITSALQEVMGRE